MFSYHSWNHLLLLRVIILFFKYSALLMLIQACCSLLTASHMWSPVLYKHYTLCKKIVWSQTTGFFPSCKTTFYQLAALACCVLSPLLLWTCSVRGLDVKDFSVRTTSYWRILLLPCNFRWLFHPVLFQEYSCCHQKLYWKPGGVVISPETM